MDIVFLTTSLERGGAETQLVRLAIRLKQRGWKVAILTMMPSTQFLEEVRAADIPLVACSEGSSRLPLGMAFRVFRQLRRWRPSLLVTFNFPADAMGRLCGRLAGVSRIIATIRTAYVKNAWRKRFYRLTEPLVAGTVSNSSAAIDYMVSQGLLTPSKTHLIPNGMITSDFPSPASAAEVRAELGIAPTDFLWMAVGNLRPAKDYPNLLAAAQACAAASPRFRLCIVGGGEELKALEEETRARGLGAILRFLGSRTDVARLLRACDAFVLSSAWEGMPNTVMEAMASGIPVVATDVGGVRELLEPGLSGVIVPPKDAKALAEAMQALMALPEEARRTMGSEARRRILDHFDIERVVDQWEQAFRDRGIGPASSGN